MRVLVVFIMSLLLQIVEAFTSVNESELLNLGPGATSLSYGGGYASLENEPFFVFHNPAALANLQQLKISAMWGDIATHNTYTYLGAGIPTMRGVLGAGIRYLKIPSNSVENAISGNLSFSKIFTEKFYVGLGLKLTSEKVEGDNKFQITGDFGVLYKLSSLNIGLSFLNLGNWFRNSAGYVVSPPITIKLGSSIKFNDLAKNIDLIPALDLMLEKNKFKLSTGIESIYKNQIFLRLGYIYGRDLADFTIGASYLFNLKKQTDLKLSYSLIPFKNRTVTHFLGLDFTFGTIDKEPPKAEIINSLTYISPNYDGKADSVVFDLNIKDNTILAGWQLEIKDKTGKSVKKYESPDMRVLKGKLNFKKIWTKLIEKKKEAPVPKQIRWDGIDEAGNVLADGKYYFTLKAWDENKNEIITEKKAVFIDTTPPKVEIDSDLRLFSPNGDGVKDTIKIFHKAGTDDDWIGQIRNDKKEVVKEYKWAGKKPDEEIIWDGKDNNGNPVPDGVYDYYISGTDNAQNSFEKKILGITLTTAKQYADIDADLRDISPNGDDKFDSVVFKLNLSDTKYLEKWKVVIMNENEIPVRVYEGTTTVPQTITWDGTDDKSKLVEDGAYFYKFEAWYSTGNNPKSFTKSIIVDKTSPEVEMKILPSIFSPDGDGNNDELVMNFNIKDISEIKDWSLNIFENEKPFKKFSGEGMVSQKIIWDGKSDAGNLVKSKNEYKIVFEITDVLENKTKTAAQKIEIDRTPPDVDFDFKPKLFSPDDDGEADKLYITISKYDNRQIASWKLEIYPKRFGKRESLFVSLKKRTIPVSDIIWDGKNDAGELVESAMDYDMVFECEDVLGNIKRIEKELNVDILVMKTERGLKIRISNIEFEYNKADLKGENTFRILNRVADVLNKYSGYSISIEGHTDNIGSEEFNRDLSERRAKSVRDYLQKRGIKEERMTTKGLWFAYPVADNKTEEGRAKNRRVEFILIKEQPKLDVPK